MGEQLRVVLQPIADWFSSFGTPEPIIHWGHPFMMGIVVFVMGSAVGLAGWRGRLIPDPEVASQSLTAHSKIAPLMTFFIIAGYTGGILSLVMQGEPILESPHFWTGSVVIILLVLNGGLALFGFKQGTTTRTIHTYLGSAALCLLFLHALLGLKLGLSL